MGDVVQFRPRSAAVMKVEARPLPPNEKRDALLRLMDSGVAMVHLDARRPGVIVPRQYANDFNLRLNFSWRYRIGDLDIGAEKIVGSLSFSGLTFRCEVPWTAIFGITCPNRPEIGEVYLKDLPDELAKPKEG
jgi:stringent starvation protein B